MNSIKNFITKNKKLWKYISIGVFASIIIFLIFGIPTDLVPNNYFIRMIPIKATDYIFLSLTSIMLGTYIALYYYDKKTNKKCNYTAYGGAVAGIFAVGCPICNVMLISLFSATAILTYFEPYRPILGVLSLGILGTALIYKIKDLKK